MSYDISLMIPVKGTQEFIEAPQTACESPNITWNVREMIIAATGLDTWSAETDMGLAKDIIPAIRHGLEELTGHPEKYKQYEAENGWGTVRGTATFFSKVIRCYDRLFDENEKIAEVTKFWIE